MKKIILISLAMATSLVCTLGCQGQQPSSDGLTESNYAGYLSGKADSSVAAVLVDFEFDGEVEADSCHSAERTIEDQLLYTIGQLNGVQGVGRLDSVDISRVETQDTEDGCFITYHARMLVAWSNEHRGTEKYTLLLPRDVSYAGAEAFTEKYSHDCVYWGAHDVTSGIYWYYYRPARQGCKLEDEDIVAIEATVSESPVHTTGRYPEYHEVWKDDALKIVAIFGKVEEGAVTNDQGITSYDRYIRDAKHHLSDYELVTVPEDIPYAPGVDIPEVSLHATLDDGTTVEIVALLVDNVRTAGAEFDNRYEELTGDADLIAYNGHSGLGANIRALAQKGSWNTGQYVIVYMNGCDTYTYLDTALADAHIAVNDDDPNGTKYLDILTNAMPSYFIKSPQSNMALLTGLMDREEPRTFEMMFDRFDSAQIVLVSGEQDNVYFPGYGEDMQFADWSWDGFTAEGRVDEDDREMFETPVVAPGRYRIELSGTGDADLYVRTGKAPTTSIFECRPFAVGSEEACEIILTVEAPIHMMVRGWEDDSEFQLQAFQVVED